VYLFLQRDVNQLINRSEALEKYMQRYLHHEGCARSKHFIKLLLLAIQNDFSKKKLGLDYEKYLQELTSFQLDTLSNNHAQEIIPYEHLWEIIYKTLE
jgi:predicted AAA+ superfamily ATPase